VLFIASSLTIKAQIVSEDFESGTMPTGWNQTITAGMGTWAVDNSLWGSSITSNYVVFFDDDANGDGSTDAAYIDTPTIDLSSYSTVNFDFDYLNAQYNNPSSLTVEVYNGTGWSQVFYTNTNDYDYDGTNDILTLWSESVDVTSYINSNFQIRFSYDDAADWSFGCAVDNIVLTSTLSNEDFSLTSEITLYPNPVVKQFEINLSEKFNSDNTTISLIDLSGKTVKTFKAAQSGLHYIYLNSKMELI